MKDEPENLDCTGYPIPNGILPLWIHSIEALELIGKTKILRDRLASRCHEKDPLFAEVDFQAASAGLTNLLNNLKRAIPYAVCPQCQGRTEVNGKCQLCKGRGFISEFLYKHAVPESIKKVRAKACHQ